MKQFAKCLIALFILLPTMSFAFTTMPPTQPVVVKVGLAVDAIGQVDERNEKIAFDGTMHVQWRDSRLQFDSKLVGSKMKYFANGSALTILNSIWQPHMVLISAHGNRQTEFRSLTINNDGVVNYTEGFQASIASPMNLRRFPFDTQRVSFELEPYGFSVQQVQLKVFPERSKIADTAALEEWQVVHTQVKVQTVKSGMSGAETSRYSLSLEYRRKPAYYIAQIIGPVMLVVFLSFAVFWITQSPIVNRVAISLTAVLTIVVFQWRVFQQLPHIAYHTYLDVFMLASFVTAGTTIVASIYIEGAKPDEARRIKMCKILFPAVYILATLVISLIFLL